MAATLATFRTQFPEFAATADGVVDRALVEALLIHSVRELATLFLTAHLLECDAKRAAGTPLVGEVASEQAGDIKATYRTQAAGDMTGGSRAAAYTRTEYGKRFLALEQRAPRHAIGARVVG